MPTAQEIEANRKLTTAQLLRILPPKTKSQLINVTVHRYGPEEGVCALGGIYWLTENKGGSDNNGDLIYFCPLCVYKKLGGMPSLIVHLNDTHILSFTEIADILDYFKSDAIESGGEIVLHQDKIDMLRAVYGRRPRRV